MMPFAAAWVDLEMIMLSGLGPAEKDKCHVTLLMCGILKKNDAGAHHPAGGKV